MPMIDVRYVTPRKDEGLCPRIAELARSLAYDRLGRDFGVTAVLVEAADPQNWFIAGETPAEAGLAAFWLDAMPAIRLPAVGPLTLKIA